jgi:hypothetical protein
LEKASISGAGTASLPEPRARITEVLSIMQRLAAPPKYCKAACRKVRHSNRLKRVKSIAKISRLKHSTSEAHWSSRSLPSIFTRCGEVSCCISSPGAK